MTFVYKKVILLTPMADVGKDLDVDLTCEPGLLAHATAATNIM